MAIEFQDEVPNAGLVWSLPVCCMERFREAIDGRSTDAIAVAAIEWGVPLAITPHGVFLRPADFAQALGYEGKIVEVPTLWSAPLASVAALAFDLELRAPQLRQLIREAEVPTRQVAGSDLVRPPDAAHSILRYLRQVAPREGAAKARADNIVPLPTGEPEIPPGMPYAALWASKTLVPVDSLARGAGMDRTAFHKLLARAGVPVVKFGQAKLCYPCDVAAAIMPALRSELDSADER